MKQAVLAALAVLALSACNSSAVEGDAARDTQIFDANTDWSTASEEIAASNADVTAFELKGKGELAGHATTFDAYVSKEGRCAGKLRRPDYTVEFQHGTDDGDLYFKASKPYWLSVAGPTQGRAVAAAVGDQWTLYPKASVASTGIFDLCDFGKWMEYQEPSSSLDYANGGLKGKAGVKFSKGKHSTILVDANDPHRVWEWNSKEIQVKFRSFNEDTYPEPPAYFVDLTKSIGS